MTDLTTIAGLQSPGDSVRERRIELGWTQAELSEQSGISQADISRIENGRLDPRWSTIHPYPCENDCKAIRKGYPENGSACCEAGWSRPEAQVDLLWLLPRSGSLHRQRKRPG